MKIWKRVQSVYSNWRTRQRAMKALEPQPANGDGHLALARESCANCWTISECRRRCARRWRRNTGNCKCCWKRSSMATSISPCLAGSVSANRRCSMPCWARRGFRPARCTARPPRHSRPLAEYDAGGVFLIDTPGINEVSGETREQLAHDVASRSDLVMFVVDGDITDTELKALRQVKARLNGWCWC